MFTLDSGQLFPWTPAHFPPRMCQQRGPKAHGSQKEQCPVTAQVTSHLSTGKGPQLVLTFLSHRRLSPAPWTPQALRCLLSQGTREELDPHNSLLRKRAGPRGGGAYVAYVMIVGFIGFQR